MRQSLPRIWPPTSYRDTSQNRSHPLPPSPPSLLCAPETPPRRKRICSDPSWTHPLPSTLYCTACGHLAPLGMWTCLRGTAGARWSVLGLHHLQDLATPPLLAVPRPAPPARPPPPLMRNGKACPCLGSVFLLIAKLGQIVMRTTDRHCTNQPDERPLHPHGSSLHPTPNTPPRMLSPHPACGSAEVPWCPCMADFLFTATVALPWRPVTS